MMKTTKVKDETKKKRSDGIPEEKKETKKLGFRERRIYTCLRETWNGKTGLSNFLVGQSTWA